VRGAWCVNCLFNRRTGSGRCCERGLVSFTLPEGCCGQFYGQKLGNSCVAVKSPGRGLGLGLCGCEGV
jgi:hypothetical protein